MFSKSYRFERKTGFLCIWLLGLGLIGIFGNLASNTDMANSFKKFDCMVDICSLPDLFMENTL